MEKRMIDFQRVALGILCGLLPVLSIGFGIVGSALEVNAPKWWWSVSATYYANSGCVMVSLLAACISGQTLRRINFAMTG